MNSPVENGAWFIQVDAILAHLQSTDFVPTIPLTICLHEDSEVGCVAQVHVTKQQMIDAVTELKVAVQHYLSDQYILFVYPS